MDASLLNIIIRNDTPTCSGQIGWIWFVVRPMCGCLCASICRYLALALTIHQHFLSEILYRIKRIISAQQFAFRYPPDIVNFPSLGS